MDRSLDPDLLRIALGGAAGPPTAEELMEQLASTEVELFKGEQSVSDPLLTTAWFLHSVGSALPALDLLGQIVNARLSKFPLTSSILRWAMIALLRLSAFGSPSLRRLRTSEAA